MNIEQEEASGKGSFIINAEGRQVALMTYAIKEDHLLVILHTEVDDSLRGQNIGSKLVIAAVNHARENGMRLRPLCTFAHTFLEKRKDLYADVLEQAI